MNTIKSFFNYLEAKQLTKLNDIEEKILHQFITLKPNKKPYADASVNQRIAALDLLLTWAYEHHYCRANHIHIYKKTHLKARTLQDRVERSGKDTLNLLSDHEQMRLTELLMEAEGFTQIRDAAIIELILTSGLFAEEIINLEAANFDIKKKTILIRGINKRDRTIMLDKTASLLLCKQWLKHRQQFLGNMDYPLLFFTQRLKPITKALLYQQIASYLAKANICKSQKGPDLLRQTAIQRMLLAGKSLEEVQNIMGHKHIASLERYDT